MNNRVIKFRAWDLANQRMVDEPYKFYAITAEHYQYKEYVASSIFYETWQDVDDGIERPCHIMQFTGLHDKEGKEKMEGDIVLYFDQGRTFKVEYIAPAFWEVCINDPSFGKSLCTEELGEVIGNVYQHSDLLKTNS